MTRQFGRGFAWRDLARRVGSCLDWPIVPTLSTQSTELYAVAETFGLPWSHYVELAREHRAGRYRLVREQ